MGNIGDGDPEPEVAAFFSNRHGIIKVLGGLAVNSYKGSFAQIHPILQIIMADP